MGRMGPMRLICPLRPFRPMPLLYKQRRKRNSTKPVSGLRQHLTSSQRRGEISLAGKHGGLRQEAFVSKYVRLGRQPLF